VSVINKWTLCALAAVLFLGLQVGAYSDDAEALRGAVVPENGIWLETLNLMQMSQAYGSPHIGQAVDGSPMKIHGETYQHGVGSHALSEFIVNLKRSATRFVSMVGVDDETGGHGSVEFQVCVDGKSVYSSGVIRGGDAAKYVSVDLTGAKEMVLRITDGGEGTAWGHADWAGAAIILVPNSKNKPEAVPYVTGATMKIASGTSKKPSINGPRVIGATPGADFLFLIPTTGEGPLTFSAENLPAGLTLNASTGIISGALASEGQTIVTLKVKGAKGSTTRKLMIIGGKHKLAQTPPLGWNSWNVWAGAVDDKKVRDAADYMVKSGLAAHGFQYINIDDTWEDKRDEKGAVQSNSKFPDMKALADYVHSKGLKLGIYSSPGPTTCAGFTASYQHEDQDAATYAKWGIDYLKYDYCSYGSIAKNDSLEELQKPYQVMRDSLDKCGRDIVYSFCEYGTGNVWEWGEKLGGNTWRTTGDISDNWASMSANGFSQDGHEKFAGPGHWNDPDMLVVGKVGWGPSIHNTHLSPNAQITHITLWCLQSSPLLIGCDMSQLDKFTLDLLTNDEVLAVDQDPLGKPAGRRVKNGMTEIWARPLWDGTMAVGMFNLDRFSHQVSVKWSDLGLTGPQQVRNLWTKKNVGVQQDSFTATIPGEGAMLIKVGTPNRTDW
jgi:alpha-galactosidase